LTNQSFLLKQTEHLKIISSMWIICSWRHLSTILLLLQELVVDVAVATSFCHADLSWARRFDVPSPRFIGRRSASTILSQDGLGPPILRLQSSGGPKMPGCRTR